MWYFIKHGTKNLITFTGVFLFAFKNNIIHAFRLKQNYMNLKVNFIKYVEIEAI